MIRQATHKDVPYILEMYKLGLQELGETEFNENMMLDKVLASYDLAPCFLLMKDGNIIGMAGLTIETSPWNGDASLSDYMFYVYPDHRSFKNFSALVEKCKGFAEELNMPLKFEIGLHDRPEARERLTKMLGFELLSVNGEYRKAS
jgi:hypothetical protein